MRSWRCVNQTVREFALADVTSWAAIRTKARCEKVIADYLTRRNVGTFLPMRLSRRTYGARVRYSELPLFPGYLFYDCDAIDRRVVFESRKVAQILIPEDQQELTNDIENLVRSQVLKEHVQRGEWGPPGLPVEVVNGPLAGATGEFVRRRGRTSLVLRVRFLGFAAEVTIDEHQIRPLNGMF